MAAKHRLEDEGPLSKRFNLTDFTDELIRDLDQLRKGKISVSDAKVRAELAKMALRAVSLIVNAQKYLDGQALVLPPPKGAPRKEHQE